jgi:hypothetical protein
MTAELTIKFDSGELRRLVNEAIAGVFGGTDPNSLKGALLDSLHEHQILADAGTVLIDGELFIEVLADDGSVEDRRRVHIYVEPAKNNLIRPHP